MGFNIVFVLGPGRSGTSLVTQILHRAGVRLSTHLIPANQANPAGYWEDRYVVETHRVLLNALGLDDLIGATVPLPADWMNHPAASAAKAKLMAYVETTMARHNGLWCIKDPRLSLLIPLWHEICVDLDISARHVFCLRHPNSVGNSIATAYELDAAIGEAVWLNRVAVFLSHMRNEFCLVHYEDLLTNPVQVIKEILAHVQDIRADKICAELLLNSVAVVRPELNHATQENTPANPLTAKIYKKLRGLSGTNSVTEGILDCVNEYLRSCDEQIGWRKCIESRRSEDLHLQLRSDLQNVQRTLDRTRGSRAFIFSEYFVEAARSYLAALKLPYRGWRFLFGPGVYEQSLREKLEQLSKKLSKSNEQRKALSGSLGSVRKAVAAFSWAQKTTLLNNLRSNGSMNEDLLRSLRIDFPLVASDMVVKKRLVENDSRKKVLYLGPLYFVEGIWDTRAKYIFPDLFDEIHEQADIFMMTSPVPPFARESLHDLCSRYGIMHFETSTEGSMGAKNDIWFSDALQLANVIRPDVVTNIFGAIALGFTIGMIGRLLPCRSVLRFAGDEIGTRKLLGAYDEDPERLSRELLDHFLGMVLVDKLITMSPWELKRVQDIVTDGTKARVCIRGVDLKKFSPKRERNAGGCVRFLYVGRKSLEKGYDLVERAADIVRERRPEIEFVFAGNFPVEQHGNRKYVGFVQSEDLPALYDQADALVLSSRTEGFPQAVAEAMAMGKPCILPDQPFGQMFRHDEDVLLTRLDAPSLADAILRLHSDPALVDRLAQSSLRIARTELDRQRWKGRYRSIIFGESESEGFRQ